MLLSSLYILLYPQSQHKDDVLLQSSSYLLALLALLANAITIHTVELYPLSKANYLDYNDVLRQVAAAEVPAPRHAHIAQLLQLAVRPAPPHTSLCTLLTSLAEAPDIDPQTRTLFCAALTPLLQILPSGNELIRQISSGRVEPDSVTSSRSVEILRDMMSIGRDFLRNYEDDEGGGKRVKVEAQERILGTPFECVLCHSSEVDQEGRIPGYFGRYDRLSCACDYPTSP